MTPEPDQDTPNPPAFWWPICPHGMNVMYGVCAQCAADQRNREQHLEMMATLREITDSQRRIVLVLDRIVDRLWDSE